MSLVLERFEDNELVILEASDGERLVLLRSYVPWYASKGDVLTLLPEDAWQGEVRYAVDHEVFHNLHLNHA